MAILKALPSRRNPQAIQQYLLQEKKLRNSFISGSQVRARNFGKQFDQVQQLYGKTTGRRYYHYILSFSPEETQQLSPREVHQMGVELAEEFFGKQGYQFAVVTHTDTDHLHDHIVVNAVNLETGKKLHTSRQDLKQIKSRVNELCQSRGLQPIPQRSEGITNGEYWAAARGQNVWKEELREAIDCVRQEAKSYDDFKAVLENEWGVTVTRDHGRGHDLYPPQQRQEGPRPKTRPGLRQTQPDEGLRGGKRSCLSRPQPGRLRRTSPQEG